jgi:hypothetical protein
MQSKLMIAAFAACAIALPTLASAQQTDSKGNAMGSDKVGNGTPKTTAPGMSGTTGTGTTGNSMSGTTHTTPSSSQGDVGPGGNNNGAPTPKK